MEPNQRIDVRAHNQAAWNRNVDQGNPWTIPVSEAELNAAFAQGWAIESIKSTVFAINPNFKGAEFSPGGPKAWFVVAQRI